MGTRYTHDDTMSQFNNLSNRKDYVMDRSMGVSDKHTMLRKFGKELNVDIDDYLFGGMSHEEIFQELLMKMRTDFSKYKAYWDKYHPVQEEMKL